MNRFYRQLTLVLACLICIAASIVYTIKGFPHISIIFLFLTPLLPALAGIIDNIFNPLYNITPHLLLNNFQNQ